MSSSNRAEQSSAVDQCPKGKEGGWGKGSNGSHFTSVCHSVTSAGQAASSIASLTAALPRLLEGQKGAFGLRQAAAAAGGDSTDHAHQGYAAGIHQG